MTNTTTRPIQYQISNGSWQVAGHADYAQTEAELIEACAAFQRKTADEVRALLGSGKTLRFGTDWYENVRCEPAPVAPVAVELVKCNCGHSVPRSQVMSASMGTACPRCYDRMSE